MQQKHLNRNIHLLHYNAPIHTTYRTFEAIAKIGFVLVFELSHNPALDLSDFFIFNHYKKHLRREVFKSQKELKRIVQDFFVENGKMFITNGLIFMNEHGYIEK